MSDATLKTTPLSGLHQELGAKIVPFAGYSMPVQFPSGIKTEHLHTRSKAGLFDVSHMGQLYLEGDGIAQALEQLVPADVVGLAQGRQRYALFTNEQGGIRDDLMIARTESDWILVVNAACKDADEAYLRQRLPPGIRVTRRDDLSLLAIQGPRAAAALSQLNPRDEIHGCAKLRTDREPPAWSAVLATRVKMASRYLYPTRTQRNWLANCWRRRKWSRSALALAIR